MSYCRWSTDGFQCDVYVYESSAGYETHVAGRRRPRRVPDLDLSSQETLSESLRQQDAVLNDPTNELQPIGLSEDGASFLHDTAKACADNLIRLRDLGYHVPQDAIAALRGRGVA